MCMNDSGNNTSTSSLEQFLKLVHALLSVDIVCHSFLVFVIRHIYCFLCFCTLFEGLTAFVFHA